jgi:hypothetical protein
MSANSDKIRNNAIKAFAAITSVDGVRSEARDAAKGASVASYGKREEILRAMAGAAAKGKWSNADLEAGVTAALTAATNGVANNSLKTFAGEISRACNERVRDHVDTFFAVSTRLWNAEKAAIEADKDAPRPISNAYARSIQLAHALMAAALGKSDGKGGWKVAPMIVTDEADATRRRMRLASRASSKRFAKPLASSAASSRIHCLVTLTARLPR